MQACVSSQDDVHRSEKGAAGPMGYTQGSLGLPCLLPLLKMCAALLDLRSNAGCDLSNGGVVERDWGAAGRILQPPPPPPATARAPHMSACSHPNSLHMIVIL